MVPPRKPEPIDGHAFSCWLHPDGPGFKLSERVGGIEKLIAKWGGIVTLTLLVLSGVTWWSSRILRTVVAEEIARALNKPVAVQSMQPSVRIIGEARAEGAR